MEFYSPIDIPTDLPSVLEVRLQDKVFFDETHADAEESFEFYAGCHAVLSHNIAPCIRIPAHARAYESGIAAYEMVGAYVAPVGLKIIGLDREATSDVLALYFSHVGTLHGMMEDLQFADYQMPHDAPRLTGAITEIVSRHCNYDEQKVRAALAGASAMRCLQLFTEYAQQAPRPQ